MKKYLSIVILSALALLSSSNSNIVNTASAESSENSSSQLSSMTVGTQSSTLTYGTSGSTSYLVTITRNNGNNSLNVSLTTSGLPSGVSGTFSPSSISFGNSGDNHDNDSNHNSRTVTLTLNTSVNSPAGAHVFSVIANPSTGSHITANGTITIKDVTAPVISSHADITKEATSPSGAVVTFTVGSIDNVDGPQPAVCSPASGSTFALGSTTVTCNKTDHAGNVASSTSFTVNVVDTTAPVITLNGSNPQSVPVGGSYDEAGATVTDAYSTGLTPTIVIVGGPIDTSIPGTYTVTYDAVDSSGNHATQVIRTVDVVDNTAPIISITGANPQTMEVNTAYVELGATVTDNVDTGLIATPDISALDTHHVGTYTVTYTATDSSEHTSTASRSVHVVDTTAPVITINSNDDTHNHIKVGDSYSDAGATATDNYDESVTVQTSGTVDTTTAGTYEITYTAEDANHNISTATRTVIVRNLGTDSTLSALSTLPGTLVPDFNSETLNYVVTLPFGTTEVPSTFATATDQEFAHVVITPATSVTSENISDRTTTITVTAEDGTTVTVYTIVFNVSPNSDPIITPPTPTVSGGGGSYGGSSGSFIGTTTLPNLLNGELTACPLITNFLQIGVNNNTTEVLKLQNFLKNKQGISVDMTGTFDTQTEAAVRTFQTKYLSDTMGPWHSATPTGRVYITTKKKINEIACGKAIPLTNDESATIGAYVSGRGNVGSTNNSNGNDQTGPTAPTTTPIIGENNDNRTGNTASVVNAPTLQRFWNFLKKIF